MRPARQATWDTQIARLRQIDPANPNLTYFANPNSPPSQEALDRLDAAIEAASIRRATDKVMPNGSPSDALGTAAEFANCPEASRQPENCSTICVSEEKSSLSRAWKER
jgi:hypothetical protein